MEDARNATQSEAQAAIAALRLKAPRLLKAHEKIRQTLFADDHWDLSSKEIEVRQQHLPSFDRKMLLLSPTRRSCFGAVPKNILVSFSHEWVGA